jgi:hypothetical protein
MPRNASLLALALATATAAAPAAATDRVVGAATAFTSYYGVAERCIRIAPLPGATYSEADLAEEAALCGMDLYDETIGLCPKIWSTSPSVVLYDLQGSKFEGERSDFQSDICAGGKIAKHVATRELARLKFTMNQAATSAAYAPAPILYYHLSRLLQTDLRVAPAVWRSIDAQVLRGEVAEGAVELTSGNEHLAMIHAAWTAILATIDEPAAYDRGAVYGGTDDLVTDGGRQLYGTLLNATGSGFDEEVNGTAPEVWDADARMALFRKTPGFIALETDAPLDQAVAVGLAGAVPPVAETLPDGVAPVQVVVWARELSETALLDFILGQQDRPGNIDRAAWYHWVENGEARRIPAAGHKPGDGTVPADALRLMHLVLNDNDAAGRIEYRNKTMRHGVLEAMRHVDAGLYLRLQAMAADLRDYGPVRRWLDSTPGLELTQSALVIENTLAAAEILAQSCEAGLLRFDLDPAAFLVSGKGIEAEVPCRPE